MNALDRPAASWHNHRMKTFGERLKTLRLAKGWSQQELGERIGVSRQAIDQFERGRNGPKWETVCALADALGVSVEEFRR